MRDDIWTDIAGPWCFVAKARFDQGLGALAHRDQPEVVHRSYELEPRAENGDVPIIDAVAAPCGRTREQQFPVVDRRLSAKNSAGRRGPSARFAGPKWVSRSKRDWRGGGPARPGQSGRVRR
ncbi:hypothetical protein SAMN05216532_0594 [Streptomyces sp. 2231.1]|nr:hypothetical protein SAMN05216532_0594 [Streptomyces sp. 2231.1]